MKLIQGSFTKRALLVGMIASSAILAASSFAMPAGGQESKAGCEARHGQKAAGKWEEKRAKHLSELKAKLKLAPAQEAAWNSFAGAGQPGMHQMGGDRQAMRGEFAKLTTPQRLDKMLAMSALRSAKMLERSEATKAFYAQLTPEQKTVFDAEAMTGRHRGHGHHRHQS